MQQAIRWTVRATFWRSRVRFAFARDTSRPLASLFLWLPLFLLTLLPVQGLCHGLNCSITPGSAGILTATTIPGDPIIFAEVKIYAPQNDSIEFANGRTDRVGRFAFVPDRPGMWTVRLVVESDHGPHLFTGEFEVDEVMDVVPFVHGGNWWERGVAGGGLLLAISGWSAYWLERRKRSG